jgi:glyoxalase family protein
VSPLRPLVAGDLEAVYGACSSRGTRLPPMVLQGLHHVTCVCSDAQRTIDFYRNELGFSLVKKTVNFDDPHSYHLYFGDEAGSPGT